MKFSKGLFGVNKNKFNLRKKKLRESEKANCPMACLNLIRVIRERSKMDERTKERDGEREKATCKILKPNATRRSVRSINSISTLPTIHSWGVENVNVSLNLNYIRST